MAERTHAHASKPTCPEPGCRRHRGDRHFCAYHQDVNDRLDALNEQAKHVLRLLEQLADEKVAG